MLTICARSSNPFHIVCYYIKWVTTSWTPRKNAMLTQYGTPELCWQSRPQIEGEQRLDGFPRVPSAVSIRNLAGLPRDFQILTMAISLENRTERERERDRETERQTERERERQRDRKKERKIYQERERESEKQRERKKINECFRH